MLYYSATLCACPIYRLRPDYSDSVEDDATQNQLQSYKKNLTFANKNVLFNQNTFLDSCLAGKGFRYAALSYFAFHIRGLVFGKPHGRKQPIGTILTLNLKVAKFRIVKHKASINAIFNMFFR